MAISTVQPPSKRPVRTSPHRVPVGVRRPLVDHRVVGEAAERVRIEHEAAAAVVEGVEADADLIVVAKLVGVAPVFVRHPLLRRRRVEDPRRDIDGAIVVGDPDVGALRRQVAVLRHHLDEIAEGLVLLVDALVEPAVERELLGELDGPHGGAPPIVARDGAGGIRRRRPVDGDDGRNRGIGAFAGSQSRPMPAALPPASTRAGRGRGPRSGCARS